MKVERRELMGAAWRFEEALKNSEDSSTLNTSFIERLNLTIRQSSAYLARRTLSHARSKEKLEDHLELVRCLCRYRHKQRYADYRIMPRRVVRVALMRGGRGFDAMEDRLYAA